MSELQIGAWKGEYVQDRVAPYYFFRCGISRLGIWLDGRRQYGEFGWVVDLPESVVLPEGFKERRACAFRDGTILLAKFESGHIFLEKWTGWQSQMQAFLDALDKAGYLEHIEDTGADG